MSKIIFLLVAILVECKTEISTANNQFGIKLYRILAKNSNEDFIIAPYPLSKLFGVLFQAGNENLTREITQLLQFLESPEEVVNDFRRILNDFEDLESVDHVKSTIFLNDSISVNSEFKAKLKQLRADPISLNSGVEVETFTEIDKWLQISNSNKTSQRNETLQSFINAKISKNSSMALLSQSFFRGSWVHRFSPEFTKPSPFYYDETHADLLPTMFQRAQVPYAEIRELDATAVALPYRLNASDYSSSEGRFELIILLPNKRMGLKSLEERLGSVPFSRIISEFKETKDLFIYLPKFTVTGWMDFANLITEAGIKSLIKDDLILPKISQEKINLQNILQFAEISIDEFGSDGVKSAVPSKFYNYNSPTVFRVNRPFIAFIYDPERYIILNIFRKLK